jgi:O-antigen/teichoic acid export membrane protein
MLVFAALDNEFFPRLSAANKNRQRSNHIVNSQVEIVMVLITPLIVGFAVCLPVLMKLLDAKFMPLVMMTQLGVVGLFFKTMMHPVACLSLSKGESRIFLLQEVLSYVFMAMVMIGGFKYYGLVGLGIGMLLYNLFDWLTVWFITKLRYDFAYSHRVWKLLISQLPILLVMLAVCIYTHSWTYVCGGAIVIAWSVVYSFRFLQHNTTFTHRLLSKVRSKIPTREKNKAESIHK